MGAYKSNASLWASAGFSVKSAKNTSAATVTNNTTWDFSGQGCSVSFTVPRACTALVVVSVGLHSSSDFEMKPSIHKGGVFYSQTDTGAAVSGGAGNRATQRVHIDAVPLTAGVNVLSPGVSISSATGGQVPAGAAQITVIVMGETTA